jgi:hypothetical protein
MKTYNINLPSIDGLISDDQLYFEGVSRPSQLYVIRDQDSISDKDIEEKTDVLEKYFNDIYNLFLRKLSSFAIFEYTNDEDAIKMQALLQELIKVKKLIEGSPVDTKQDLL